jgi:AbrB family looped-hinge helix DNA binding protein
LILATRWCELLKYEFVFILENMRIGERGQVTIPKAIRDRFGLHAKTEVEFRLEAGVIVLKRVRRNLAPKVEGAVWQRLLRARVLFGGQVHGRCSRTMITAIGTNILLDVLIPNETFADASMAAVEEASQRPFLGNVV